MTGKDLVVLVADKDMQHALKGLLARPQAMGIRPIAHDVYVHPRHDPACARKGVSFLSGFAAAGQAFNQRRAFLRVHDEDAGILTLQGSQIIVIIIKINSKNRLARRGVSMRNLRTVALST